MSSEYEDILALPHHQSIRRKRMALSDRAAQFAPFAALTGYDDSITEKSRLTEPQKLLSEYQQDILDRTLQYLLDSPALHPYLIIHSFHSDTQKPGGSYQQFSGRLKKIDSAQQQLILENGTTLPLNQIVEIIVVDHPSWGLSF